MEYTPEMTTPESIFNNENAPLWFTFLALISLFVISIIVFFHLKRKNRKNRFYTNMAYLSVALLVITVVVTCVTWVVKARVAYNATPTVKELFLEQIEDRYGVDTTLGEVESLLKVDKREFFLFSSDKFSPEDVTYEEFGKAFVVLNGEPVKVQLVKVVDDYKLVFVDENEESVKYEELPVKK